MMLFRKNRGKIVSVIFIIAILVLSYEWGGNIPSEKNAEKEQYSEISSPVAEKHEILPENPKPQEKTSSKEPEGAEQHLSEPLQESETETEASAENFEYSLLQGMKINKETGVDEYETQPVPEGKPVPIEPQTVTISDKQMTCTLSIRCSTLLDNLKYLDEAKRQLVPADGIILAEKQVTFYEGESVFNVLLRETRRNNIHMEYVSTPIYNSAYIEGIHNLYEFDCGELSGWMYSVNGWFPNYGCSRYALKEGDRIEWIYTCALGKDVK